MRNKTKTTIIDQSQLDAPILWESTVARSDARVEYADGSGLWQTGPERKAVGHAIGLIDSAQQVVVLCSFLLSDAQVIDALLRASTRGVRVYVMLAAENRLVSEPPEDDKTSRADWERKVRGEFTNTLSRLGGFALVRASEDFHAKVVIVDSDKQPEGMLFTANLTTEAVERNHELAVRLTPTQAQEFMQVLRWGFWESATHEVGADGVDLSPTRPLGQIPKPSALGSVIVTAAGTNSIRAELCAAIAAERKSIIVSSFGWSADHEVVRALIAKAQAGVQVQVFARPRAAAMPALIALERAGAIVKGFKYLHAKALWTESGPSFIMSANLEAHGLDSGFELGVKLKDRDRSALRQMFDEWSASAEWRLRTGSKLGQIKGSVQVWRSQKLEEATVEVMLPIKLPEKVVASAELLDSTEPEMPSGPLQLAHRIEVFGEFLAPTRHPKAKEVMRRDTGADGKARSMGYLPRVYEHEGKKFVEIEGRHQMEAALRLKSELNAHSIVFQGDER